MPANKLWAILKVSRKQYATARPWKNEVVAENWTSC